MVSPRTDQGASSCGERCRYCCVGDRGHGAHCGVGNAGVRRERHRAGKGTSNDTIEVRNEGRTDIVVRHIVIEPGGSTGWHYHPGELIAVVHKGTLTRTLEDCSVQVSSAGQSLVEAAGDSHAHSGRNLAASPWSSTSLK